MDRGPLMVGDENRYTGEFEGDGGVPHDAVSDGVLESILGRLASPNMPGSYNAVDKVLAITRSLKAELEQVKKQAKADRDRLCMVGMGEIERLALELLEAEAELEQVKKERDEARADAANIRLNLSMSQGLVVGTESLLADAEAERDRLAEALRMIEGMPTTERNPDGDEQAAHSMQLVAHDALASMEGGSKALRESTKEPPCPGCGMTAQVAPSRKEPGLWMCHGCARVFDVASMEGDRDG